MNKKNIGTIVVTGALALIVGTGLGAASATPEVQVERVVQTKEVAVAQTPDACIEALDLADEGFLSSAVMLGLTGQALDASVRLSQAILDMDFVALGEINTEVDRLNAAMDEVETPDADAYNAAKAECRNAA